MASLVASLNFKVKNTKEKLATSDFLKCVPRALEKCMLMLFNIQIPLNHFLLCKAVYYYITRCRNHWLINNSAVYPNQVSDSVHLVLLQGPREAAV